MPSIPVAGSKVADEVRRISEPSSSVGLARPVLLVRLVHDDERHRERPARQQQAEEPAHRLGGVVGLEQELERGRGDDDRPVAPRQPQRLHPPEVHAPVDVQAGGRRLRVEPLEHLGGVVDAVDVDAVGEEVEKEPPRPRPDIQHRLPPLPDDLAEPRAVRPGRGIPPKGVPRLGHEADVFDVVRHCPERTGSSSPWLYVIRSTSSGRGRPRRTAAVRASTPPASSWDDLDRRRRPDAPPWCRRAPRSCSRRPAAA